VNQLGLLAFTISFLSAVLVLPCHGVVISRFKIGFEFIQVQVNGSYFPYSQKISMSREHFTRLYRAVTERILLVVHIYQH